MCRPISCRPCCFTAASASSSSACQMPCLLCSPPVLVLLLWPWPKPGLMRSQTGWPWRDRAQLVQHVDGAGVHRHAVFDDGGQRGVVEQVGGEDDARGALRVELGGEAGGQRAQDLAARNRVDHHALLAHQAQQVDVGVGFLGEADGVEGAQFGDAGADGGGVVDPQRGAVLAGEGLEQGIGEGVHGHG